MFELAAFLKAHEARAGCSPLRPESGRCRRGGDFGSLGLEADGLRRLGPPRFGHQQGLFLVESEKTPELR